MNEYEIAIGIFYVENRSKRKIETGNFFFCKFAIFVQTSDAYSHYLPLWWENFQLNEMFDVLSDKSTSTELP